jgi:hypothetical protein
MVRFILFTLFARIAFTRRSTAFLLVLLTATHAHAGAPSCKSVFQIPPASLPFETEASSLSQLRLREVKWASPRQVRRMNTETVTQFGDYKPTLAQEGGRGAQIEYAQLTKLLDVLKQHPVVGRASSDRYQQETAEIGYCFGRALYVQLMLLKMGLNSDSIRKVWIVGPMRNPDGANWGFHVATAAYVKGFGWMAIDTNTFKIQALRHWYSHFYDNSIDGLARFYVTDANRFTADFSQLSRLQLGLDLPIDKDWYRHYFVHMLESIRQSNISELGLRSVDRSAGPPETKVQTKSSGQPWFSGFRDLVGI